MGAAASFSGQTAKEFENFKKIRDEYEAKVASGASDVDIYDHIHAEMRSLGMLKLSLDLLQNKNEHNNCTEEVIRRAGLNLLGSDTSKVGEVKIKVEAALQSIAESKGWGTIPPGEAPCPVVTEHDNFDSLKVPTGHYSRLPSDCYYCCKNVLLRTQLSAHLQRTVTSGSSMYFMSGETFRIIEEDDTQSELQHKLEFVRIFDVPEGAGDDNEEEYVNVAESIVKALIGEELKIRWEESDEAFHLIGEAYNDLQVKFGELVLEVARGGKFTDEMLASLGYESSKTGYCITFDLDHLAMVVNSITDIRSL